MRDLKKFAGVLIPSPKQFIWRLRAQECYLAEVFRKLNILKFCYLCYDNEYVDFWNKLKVHTFHTDVLSQKFYGTSYSNWDEYVTVDGTIGAQRISDEPIRL
jgi:hypothetical protein